MFQRGHVDRCLHRLRAVLVVGAGAVSVAGCPPNIVVATQADDGPASVSAFGVIDPGIGNVLRLTWEEPVSPAPSSVIVRRGRDAACPTTAFDEASDLVEAEAQRTDGRVTVDDVGVIDGLEFCYAVFAVYDDGGATAAPALARGTSTDRTAPSAPALAAASRDSGGVRLSIAAPDAPNDIVQGLLRRALGDVAPSGPEDGDEVAVLGEPDFNDGATISDPAPGEGAHVAYAFFVTDEAGNVSPASTTTIVVNDAVPPAPPLSVFAVAIDAATVDVHWLPNTQYPLDYSRANVEPVDLDADGVPTSTDLCPLTADPTNVDADSDRIGDVCDADVTIFGNADVSRVRVTRRGPDGAGTVVFDGLPGAPARSRFKVRDRGLAPSTTYTYAVQLFDAAGNPSDAREAAATTVEAVTTVSSPAATWSVRATPVEAPVVPFVLSAMEFADGDIAVAGQGPCDAAAWGIASEAVPPVNPTVCAIVARLGVDGTVRWLHAYAGTTDLFAYTVVVYSVVVDGADRVRARLLWSNENSSGTLTGQRFAGGAVDPTSTDTLAVEGVVECEVEVGIDAQGAREETTAYCSDVRGTFAGSFLKGSVWGRTDTLDVLSLGPSSGPVVKLERYHSTATTAADRTVLDAFPTETLHWRAYDRSGGLVWDAEVPAAVQPSAAISDDGTVGFSPSRGAVHTIDLATGVVVETLTLAEGAIAFAPVIAGDAIAVPVLLVIDSPTPSSSSTLVPGITTTEYLLGPGAHMIWLLGHLEGGHIVVEDTFGVSAREDLLPTAVPPSRLLEFTLSVVVPRAGAGLLAASNMYHYPWFIEFGGATSLVDPPPDLDPDSASARPSSTVVMLADDASVAVPIALPSSLSRAVPIKSQTPDAPPAVLVTGAVVDGSVTLSVSSVGVQ